MDRGRILFPMFASNDRVSIPNSRTSRNVLLLFGQDIDRSYFLLYLHGIFCFVQLANSTDANNNSVSFDTLLEIRERIVEFLSRCRDLLDVVLRIIHGHSFPAIVIPYFVFFFTLLWPGLLTWRYVEDCYAILIISHRGGQGRHLHRTSNKSGSMNRRDRVNAPGDPIKNDKKCNS